ncbi:hypothetical protein [Cupriavidus necator]|uniref:hypothetical protein n=1 Tax=Cupriavidus necator TaxID=106590 RepID=UPI0005B2F294|nr:hypothetical protein [Cupriavidus necator]
MIRTISVVAAVTVATLMAGCAATHPTPTSHGVSSEFKASVSKGVAQPVVVANGHQINPEVSKSLLDSFAAQADKFGVKVIPNGVPVTITVQEYSARPTAARLLAGALAGKHHIKADVALGESKFVVEDTARTVLVGINGVAANVGVQAANGVAGIAGLSQAN